MNAECSGRRAASLPLTLYVHMPWCVRKCPYCDFNSHQLKSAAPSGDYIDALIRDFEAELPRLPTGKLYKRLLRDRYWGNKTSRIV